MAFEFEGLETIKSRSVMREDSPERHRGGGRDGASYSKSSTGDRRPPSARRPENGDRRPANARHGNPVAEPEAWKIFDIILNDYKGKVRLSQIRLLFPRPWTEDQIRDWLDKDQRFCAFTDDSESLKFVSVHCRARLCIYYGQGQCTKDNCENFHYCRNFLAGQCKIKQHCRYNHSFDDEHNTNLKRRLHLGKYSNHQMKSILKHSIPQVCSSYNGLACNMGDSCTFLHVCKGFVMKECLLDECSLDHSFDSEHTMRLLKVFKLDRMAYNNEHMLKKNILTIRDDRSDNSAPRPDTRHENREERKVHPRDSSDHIAKMSALSMGKDENQEEGEASHKSGRGKSGGRGGRRPRSRSRNMQKGPKSPRDPETSSGGGDSQAIPSLLDMPKVRPQYQPRISTSGIEPSQIPSLLDMPKQVSDFTPKSNKNKPKRSPVKATPQKSPDLEPEPVFGQALNLDTGEIWLKTKKVYTHGDDSSSSDGNDPKEESNDAEVQDQPVPSRDKLTKPKIPPKPKLRQSRDEDLFAHIAGKPDGGPGLAWYAKIRGTWQQFDQAEQDKIENAYLNPAESSWHAKVQDVEMVVNLDTMTACDFDSRRQAIDIRRDSPRPARWQWYMSKSLNQYSLLSEPLSELFEKNYAENRPNFQFTRPSGKTYLVDFVNNVLTISTNREGDVPFSGAVKRRPKPAQ